MRIAFIGTEKGLLEHTRSVLRSDMVYMVMTSVDDTRGHKFHGYILHESSVDIANLNKVIEAIKSRI